MERLPSRQGVGYLNPPGRASSESREIKDKGLSVDTFCDLDLMKKHRTLIAVILSIAVALSGMGMPFAEASYIALSSASYAVLDAKTHKILYSRAPYTKRAPASTAKLVSAMVILDHLDPDQVIRVAPSATRVQPSKIHIAPGERFYVRDLIKAMLLYSANDAAYALAVASAGSVPVFSSRMNVKARLVGAKHSRFVSPAGLPAEGQYTTAYDLAKIAAAAQRYPLIVQTMRQRYAVIYSLNGRKFYLKNTNKMLWASQGREIIGKTGYTRAARHCFAGRIKVNGRTMLVGLMSAPRRTHLWSDLKKVGLFPPSLSKQAASNPILVNRRLHDKKTVKKIQMALKRAGYFKGPVNGNFGPMTLDATKRFQRAKGLTVDGIVQSRTWAKLKPYL